MGAEKKRRMKEGKYCGKPPLPTALSVKLDRNGMNKYLKLPTNNPFLKVHPNETIAITTLFSLRGEKSS